MAMYAYEGRTSTGESRKGEIEAPDQDAARKRLRAMQIQPTSLKAKGGGMKVSVAMPNFLKPKVGTKDLVIFTRQFATMIDSGLPLVQCLDIQSKQAPNPTFREELAVIKEQVESGSTFADALKKFPGTFDDLFRNMVAAGEVGGILDTILNRLAAYLEKADKLRRQVKGAMAYPVGVSLVAGAVTSLLLLKVVPTFETMFAEMGAALPAPTQFVVDLSRWLQNNVLFVIVGIILMIVGVRQLYKTERGKVAIDGFLLKIPVFGDLLKKVAVARFTRTLGTMIASGVPILEALEICGRTAGNRIIENAISKVRDSIAEGRTIAEPLSETGVFPEMVCQMIGVGEATGALDVMLSKIADFYEDEVDQAVETVTSLMEPMIMVVMGIIIGGLVIAMYLPIFSMAGNIN
ncbi:MAG: type II secretion system F family protein [Alphaproteobacteria bacterium]|nr:type II secretion system F family protein [Alphaproteobacteria bacterium]